MQMGKLPLTNFFWGFWHLVAFIDHYTQIKFYTVVFYGLLHRIAHATFLQLKIQLETVRFEPWTFRVPVLHATN